MEIKVWRKMEKRASTPAEEMVVSINQICEKHGLSPQEEISFLFSIIVADISYYSENEEIFKENIKIACQKLMNVKYKTYYKGI